MKKLFVFVHVTDAIIMLHCSVNAFKKILKWPQAQHSHQRLTDNIKETVNKNGRKKTWRLKLKCREMDKKIKDTSTKIKITKYDLDSDDDFDTQVFMLRGNDDEFIDDSYWSQVSSASYHIWLECFNFKRPHRIFPILFGAHITIYSNIRQSWCKTANWILTRHKLTSNLIRNSIEVNISMPTISFDQKNGFILAQFHM